MRIILKVIVMILSINSVVAQKIKIVDSKTLSGIPFVNVQVLDGKSGSTSDIDGILVLNEKYKKGILISHIGYHSLQILSPYPAIIKLEPKENTLNEVIVSNFNPAIEIIKKAIANRNLNNPKKLHSFSYFAYSKLSTDFEKNDSLKNKNQYFLMSESRTKHQFLKPNFEQETLLSHKTSGFKNPLFASIITNLQPSSFYDELIRLRINKKDYLNPISPNSWKKYDFFLSDTLINEKDSTYVISFSPKINTTFEGFNGILHINTDRYAIENISVEPANEISSLHFKMQQRYERVMNQWFPKQQNTELIFTILVPNDKATGPKDMMLKSEIKYRHKSYFTDISINDSTKRKDFSTISRTILPKSYNADEDFWGKYRSDSLSLKEKNTYRFYESLPTKQLDKIDLFFDLIETLISGHIPFGKFQIPIDKIIQQNRFEGSRLGIGLTTGDEISKRVSLGGYLGYGFRDKAFKYGISTTLKFNNFNHFLRLSYQQDLEEPASVNYDFGRKRNLLDLGFRNFLTERMDKVERLQVINQSPISRTGLFQFGMTKEIRQAGYLYQFFDNETNTTIRTYSNTSLNLKFRWAWGEKYTQLSRVTYQSEPPKTILELSFDKGIAGLLNSDFDFERVNIHYENQIKHRRLGTTLYQIDVSKVWGNVPYSFLFNGRGSSNQLGFLMIPSTFQTMGLYEFTSDQQFSVLIQQNFGRIFPSKKSYFQPEISIHQGISYGSLANPQNHSLIDVKTLERGFYETGISLNRLLRIKYLHIFYLDFGVGIFTRYGANSFDSPKDNIAGRWMFGISF
jgi:hypothetical protein